MAQKEKRKVNIEWKSDKEQIRDVWYKISPEIFLKTDETQVHEIKSGKNLKRERKKPKIRNRYVKRRRRAKENQIS